MIIIAGRRPLRASPPVFSVMHLRKNAAMGKRTEKTGDRRHSLLGIAACMLGAVMFGLFVAATVLYVLQFERRIAAPADDGLAILLMLTEMVIPVPVHIFAALLGSIALFFKGKKKTFPILAIVSNIVFGVLGLLPWAYLAIVGLGRAG